MASGVSGGPAFAKSWIRREGGRQVIRPEERDRQEFLNWAVNFQNQWSLNGGIAHNIEGLDTDMLRGGPSVIMNPKSLMWMNIATDRRKTFNAIFSTNYTVEHGTGGRTVAVLPNIEIRPITWISLKADPQLRWMSNPWQ